MLKALSLDLHGGEDEAVAHKVRRVAHALRCLKAARREGQDNKLGIIIFVTEKITKELVIYLSVTYP